MLTSTSAVGRRSRRVVLQHAATPGQNTASHLAPTPFGPTQRPATSQSATQSPRALQAAIPAGLHPCSGERPSWCCSPPTKPCCRRHKRRKDLWLAHHHVYRVVLLQPLALVPPIHDLHTRTTRKHSGHTVW